MGKDFITVVLLSGDLFQWDGVGSITVEDFLVDVDTDSGNAAPDMMSGKVVLYQYAANFLFVPVVYLNIYLLQFPWYTSEKNVLQLFSELVYYEFVILCNVYIPKKVALQQNS